MSKEISPRNVVNTAFCRMAGVELAAEGESLMVETPAQVWEKTSDAITSKLIKDPEAAKFAGGKFFEKCLDGFSRDSEGLCRCSCTTKNFHHETGFSSLISHFNPAWEGKSKSSERAHEEAFEKAVEFAIKTISELLRNYSEEVYQGFSVVDKAVKDTYDPTTKCIFLERFVPWRDHIYDVEEAHKCQVNWVVFQDDRSLQWRVTSVSDKTDRFFNRDLLDSSLRGLQGPEIAAKIGVPADDDGKPDQFFVHHSGFTGGAPTQQAVLTLLKFKSEI